jgi:hypothetical protein
LINNTSELELSHCTNGKFNVLSITIITI